MDPRGLRRPRLGRRASQATLAGRLVRGPGESDGVRDPRPARRRHPRVRARSLGRLAARGLERRRRLGLSARGRQRPGQHRGRAPGSGGGRELPPGDGTRSVLPAARPAQRRRVRAGGGWAHQFAVHRLGGPGPDRRRRPIPTPCVRTDAAPWTTWLAARSATATIGTRRRATRRPSGSPPRSSMAVSRKAFPLAAVPRTRTDAGSGRGPGGGRRVGAVRSRVPPGEPRRGIAARPVRPPRSPATRQGPGAPCEGRSPRARVRPHRRPRPPPRRTTTEGGLGTSAYVGAGFGLLTAALAGGFLWYRRRLP